MKTGLPDLANGGVAIQPTAYNPVKHLATGSGRRA